MVKTLKTDIVKIGLVQASVSNDIGKNLEKTGKLIKKAADKGAEIVCLQELFATRYFAQKEDKKFFFFAEKIPGKITNFLSESAKANNISLVGGSLYEKGEDNNYYNTSLIFDSKGRIAGKYRKIHIPYDPRYYEKYYFTPGNLGYVNVQLPQIKIAPLICYDQWYPEAARMNALQGVNLIFYPTAIGWFKDLKKYESFSAKRWENAMAAHASLNGIYVAAVNRVGKEDELDFWGGSFVADPFGQVIARASSTKDEVLIADIDLEKIEMSQKGWGFLSNRRPDSYGGLVR